MFETYYLLFSARPHDVNFLVESVENFSGIVPTDRGFIDALRQALLNEFGISKILFFDIKHLVNCYVNNSHAFFVRPNNDQIVVGLQRRNYIDSITA